MRKVNVEVKVELLIRADDDADIEQIVQNWTNGIWMNEKGDVEEVTIIDFNVTDSR